MAKKSKKKKKIRQGAQKCKNKLIEKCIIEAFNKRKNLVSNEMSNTNESSNKEIYQLTI